MSFLFLAAFLAMVQDKIPADEMTTEFFIIWALFSIADALWIRRKT